MSTIRSPFGTSDSQAPAYAATIAVSIANDKTIITPATLTGNATINATIDSEVVAGAEIILIATADGSDRTVDLGTGFNSSTPDLVIPATTTMTATYVYSGTEYVEKSEPTGIDAVAVATATTHVTSNGSDHSIVGTNTTAIGNITDGTTAFTGTVATTVNNGAVGAGTVTAVECGTGYHHITVLTLTDFVVGALAGAGAALAMGNLLYEFPAGGQFLYTAGGFDQIVLTAAGTAVNADLGLGSLIGSTAQATLDAVNATCEDYLTGQTVATAAGGGLADDILLTATAGALTGISLNGVGAEKSLFLNAAGTWNADNTGNLTASGTIVLIWDTIS